MVYLLLKQRDSNFKNEQNHTRHFIKYKNMNNEIYAKSGDSITWRKVEYKFIGRIDNEAIIEDFITGVRLPVELVGGVWMLPNGEYESCN